MVERGWVGVCVHGEKQGSVAARFIKTASNSGHALVFLVRGVWYKVAAKKRYRGRRKEDLRRRWGSHAHFTSSIGFWPWLPSLSSTDKLVATDPFHASELVQLRQAYVSLVRDCEVHPTGLRLQLRGNCTRTQHLHTTP